MSEEITWADERIREIESSNLARIAAKGEPARRGQRMSAATKHKLREIAMERQREADDGSSALRTQRLAAGMSQEQLADRAMVDPATIRTAENGTRPVAAATWRRLARALNVKVATIDGSTAPTT